MTDSAYYHAIVGRLRGFSNIAWCTDLPATWPEAEQQFHAHLKDSQDSEYNPRDVVIEHVFISTECIDPWP